MKIGALGAGFWAQFGGMVVVDFYPIIIAEAISFAATGAYQTLQNLVAPIHVLLRHGYLCHTNSGRTYDQSSTPKLKRTLNLIFCLAEYRDRIADCGCDPDPQMLYMLKGETFTALCQRYLSDGIVLFLYVYQPTAADGFQGNSAWETSFLANILAAVSMFTVGVWLINQWGFMAQLPVGR